MTIEVQRLHFLALVFPAVLSAASALAAPLTPELEFFEQKIRPVLVQHCYRCHSESAGDKLKGGLHLDSRVGVSKGGDTGSAVVAGDPDGSLIVQAMRYGELRMPPNGKLPDSVIADFEKWIRDGTVDPRETMEKGATRGIDIQAGRRFWSFQRPTSQTLPLPVANGPALEQTNQLERRTDAFVNQKIAEAGLTISPAADRRQFFRRLTLDLTGLLPSVDEVNEFADDSSEFSYERAIERQMASPAYGEKWAHFWLDVMRYAEDQAHIVGNDASLTYPNAYSYRDWVITSLNRDLPYDQFVRQQLAADFISPDDHDSQVALGFLGLRPKYYDRKNLQVMSEEWADRMFLNRRQMLGKAGAGFGMLGLAGVLNSQFGEQSTAQAAALSTTYFVPRAKRVIFLFMNGGPSHVDTFDPKPALLEQEGKPPSDVEKRKVTEGWMPSPFTFRPCGESGVVMSELFQHLSNVADDLCVVRSMHTDVPNHEPGLLLMNSGNQQPVRPSLGSWVSYGLGTENENLPSFVVLAPRRPVVGPLFWSSSFLPGAHQGVALNTADMQVDQLISNLKHPPLGLKTQRRQMDLVVAMNRIHAQQRQRDSALEAQIRALEVAFPMQTEANEAFDVSREPEYLRRDYGDSTFGQSCLLARRLAERGGRFVQVYYLSPKNNQPWDTHADNNNRHRELCADADRASATLIRDLKQRGLLDDTMVILGGELGSTPYAQQAKDTKPGRDHHHTDFSMLLAGGGTRGGMMYGGTDEFGMHSIEKNVHVHDLHATILHLMGIDHERLTYRHSGRGFRLTDVHGTVVRDILA